MQVSELKIEISAKSSKQLALSLPKTGWEKLKKLRIMWQYILGHVT